MKLISIPDFLEPREITPVSMAGGECTTFCEVYNESCSDWCENYCETQCEQCESACEISCQTTCESSCQTGCQVSCETTCQNSCQDYCEDHCQVGCQVSAQNAQPNAPTFQSPAHNAGWTLNRNPLVRLQVTDPDGNNIRQVTLEAATDTAFTLNKQTVTVSINVTSGSVVTVQFPAGTLLPVGTVYLRARASDGSLWGSYSATRQILIKDPTTYWTIPTASIDPAGPGVKLSMVTEARAAISAARLFRGLMPSDWVDGTLTADSDIRGIHLRQARLNMDELLSTIGAPAAVWTDALITDLLADQSNVATATDRKGVHWIELRQRLQEA